MKYLVGIIFWGVIVCSQAKNFVIGVQNVSYYPLYDFPNPSYSKELLDAFAKSKGYTFNYLPLPVKRINHWYKENSIDFKFPDNSRWLKGIKLTEQVKYSSSLIELIACSMVKTDKLGKPKKEIKKLGTLLGFHATMWIDSIRNGDTQLIESSSTLNIVKQTIFGLVDANNLEPNVVNHHLRLLKKERELAIDKSLPHETYHYHLSTIKHLQVLQELDQFLLANQSLIQSLKAKYHILDPRPYRVQH